MGTGVVGCDVFSGNESEGHNTCGSIWWLTYLWKQSTEYWRGVAPYYRQYETDLLFPEHGSEERSECTLAARVALSHGRECQVG